MRTLVVTLLAVFLAGCGSSQPATGDHPPSATSTPSNGRVPAPGDPVVPHEERWGIYHLDLTTDAVELLYTASHEITTVRPSFAGDRLVFSQKVGGDSDENREIFTIRTDGSHLHRLTDNNVWDLYPAWSPDGSEIAFLSWRDADLDIYVMNAAGGDPALLFDSGRHDSDQDWVGSRIAFTSDSRIWVMQDDGTDAHQVTDPPRAGERGDANLPFGDYDPRISPDGSRIVFERLVDDRSPHGNYDFFSIDADGANVVRLTANGYSQGLANWSPSGDLLVFVVGAIGDVGQFDIYLMQSDGTESRNVTPDYFPSEFLCHEAIFAGSDTSLFFVGEWWADN